VRDCALRRARFAGGGYADNCVAPRTSATAARDGSRDGGGDSETFFTVWTNVFDRGHLEVYELI
jgi:hypothetical protein